MVILAQWLRRCPVWLRCIRKLLVRTLGFLFNHIKTGKLCTSGQMQQLLPSKTHVVRESLPQKACWVTKEDRQPMQHWGIKLHPFWRENATPHLKPQWLHGSELGYEFEALPLSRFCWHNFAGHGKKDWSQKSTSGAQPWLWAQGLAEGVRLSWASGSPVPAWRSDVLYFEVDKWSHRELLLWYELFPLLLNNKHDHSDLLAL